MQVYETQTQKYELKGFHMSNHVKGLVVTEIRGTVYIVGKVEDKETARSLIYNHIMNKLWEKGYGDAKVDIHIKNLTVLEGSKPTLTLVRFDGTVIVHIMTIGGGADSIFIFSELKL